MDTYEAGDDAVVLRGIELRYALTYELAHLDEPLEVDKLVEALEDRGFAVPGRASKTVSDALRWERRRGRVRRCGRGVYGPGTIPRATEHRIYQRVMIMRARANVRRELDDYFD